MTSAAPTPLKTRLGLGAALLGAGTLATATILFLGLNEVADRLDAALASDQRMARYAGLSTQASTFLIVATELVQADQPPEVRTDRVASIAERMRETFALLQQDVETAVRAVEAFDLDEQSRYGTQSLGLARMDATFASALRGFTDAGADPVQQRAHLDAFAAAFDPLLSQAVNTEVLFRNAILAGIDSLRTRLTLMALTIAALTLLAVAFFYLRLIRPQFARLDALREAARKISQADFTVSLPVSQGDEIGQLAAETNRMAAALRDRQQAIDRDRQRLSEIIDARTAELRRANAALSETDEKRRRFFADISHELRTPLTVILMEAQLGRQGTPDPQEAFVTIETRAARLNRRIDDLLRLARSDTGELALDPTPTPLPALVAEVEREIAAEVDAAGMTLRVDPMPDIVLLCDRNWMRQVVVSLVRNAIRHARAGGSICIAPLQDASLPGLAISDNGPGIPTDEQSQIFERFRQGTSATAHQGFGMGLALAAWVVTAQKGKIDVESPLPRDAALGAAPGTKIAVRLPPATP